MVEVHLVLKRKGKKEKEWSKLPRRKVLIPIINPTAIISYSILTPSKPEAASYHTRATCKWQATKDILYPLSSAVLLSMSIYNAIHISSRHCW